MAGPPIRLVSAASLNQTEGSSGQGSVGGSDNGLDEISSEQGGMGSRECNFSLYIPTVIHIQIFYRAAIRGLID